MSVTVPVIAPVLTVCAISDGANNSGKTIAAHAYDRLLNFIPDPLKLSRELSTDQEAGTIVSKPDAGVKGKVKIRLK